MKKGTRALALLSFVGASLSAPAAPVTDNVRDFDVKTNDLAEGRWAYGWFNAGSINDPKKPLRLFTQAYPEARFSMGNWAVDAKKREGAWAIVADGRAYVDRADVAWIYTIPAELAGSVRVAGTASGGGSGKRLRVFVARDEFFTGIDRASWKPVFDDTGSEISLDLTVRVGKGSLLFFVQNDTATPPNYRSPQKLHVTLSKAD